ncbi:hypothetical protein BSKO_02430 [Bryopsis sp. KO-2023]|nr:hypothetical protein BSKO_02430 [Bryopsis sp. KO-2023]
MLLDFCRLSGVIEESLGAENLKRQGKEVDGDISCMKLYEAVKDLDLPLVKAYIASGFNVNVRIHNSTPLRWAVDIGHVPMVEALLHAGANFNAKDDLGYTPLHCASRNGDIKIVEILLSWGANKNLRTSKGLARELIPDNGFVPTTKKLFDLLS